MTEHNHLPNDNGLKQEVPEPAPRGGQRETHEWRILHKELVADLFAFIEESSNPAVAAEAIARWLEDKKNAASLGRAEEPKGTWDDDVPSLLASATDLLNSWARETGVPEARNEKDIKGVIDRLWSELSTRLHAPKASIAFSAEEPKGASVRDILQDSLLGLRVLRSIGNARSYKVVGTTKCPNWGKPIVESCDSLIERIEEQLLLTGKVVQSDASSAPSAEQAHPANAREVEKEVERSMAEEDDSGPRQDWERSIYERAAKEDDERLPAPAAAPKQEGETRHCHNGVVDDCRYCEEESRATERPSAARIQDILKNRHHALEHLHMRYEARRDYLQLCAEIDHLRARERALTQRAEIAEREYLSIQKRLNEQRLTCDNALAKKRGII